MANARSCPTLLLARQAAEYLRAGGVPATVVGGLDAFGGAGVSLGGGRFSVVVEDANLELARVLLEEMDETPVEHHGDLDAQSRPDLSRLDKRIEAPCPGCGRRLPLDASLTKCRACGAAADVTEILINKYGPEVLEACYPSSPEDIPEEVLESALVNCPGCGYTLAGLAAAGLCPECGTPYSKQELLRRRSGLL